MAGPEMLKLMRNLRAVREYTAEPVSPQALERSWRSGAGPAPAATASRQTWW